MNIPDWIIKLFQTIDTCDTEGFIKFLTDDAMLTFGNAKPLSGKIAIRNVIKSFFDSIKGLRHKVLEVWVVKDSVICRGEVTYIRKDETQLTVPFANIFKMDGKLIRQYLIYVDISQLYT